MERGNVMTITNNVSNYNDVLLVSQGSLGIRSVFSLHSVAALFLCLFGSSTTLTDRKAKGDPETSSG